MADHVFPIRVLTSLSVDEILLPRYVNCFSVLRGLLSSVEVPSFLNSCTQCYRSSHRGQYSLLPPPSYVVVTQPVPVYLQEAQGHQRSLHL